ncbi:unnamed protein product, partial [Polarella glacialis]
VVAHQDNCSAPSEIILHIAAQSGFPSAGLLSAVMTPFVPDTLPASSNSSADFSAGASPVTRGGGNFALCQRKAAASADA